MNVYTDGEGSVILADGEGFEHEMSPIDAEVLSVSLSLTADRASLELLRSEKEGE